MSLSEKSAAGFTTDVGKALEVAISGNEADAEKALAAVRDNLDAWAAKLTELAGQPIVQPVQAELTGAATVITSLSSPDDKTPVAQAEKNLKEAVEKIKTACG